VPPDPDINLKIGGAVGGCGTGIWNTKRLPRAHPQFNDIDDESLIHGATNVALGRTPPIAGWEELRNFASVSSSIEGLDVDTFVRDTWGFIEKRGEGAGGCICIPSRFLAVFGRGAGEDVFAVFCSMRRFTKNLQKPRPQPLSPKTAENHHGMLGLPLAPSTDPHVLWTVVPTPERRTVKSC
jgi:hypothetical protein